MPSPAFSSESGLESDAHLHISSSCASSGGGGGVPAGAAGRILFSLPGGLAHHYNALQASMSSGDNFIQGGRNLSLAPGHGMLPLPSRVVHEGRVWTSFQVMPSASSMGQPSGVSVQGSQGRHGDNNKSMEAGAMEEHGSNNEHGGASFAEHDYMSDVSSAPNEDSNKCGERSDGGKGCDDAQDTDSNLNLRETELRLGPPESSSSTAAAAAAASDNKAAAAALLSGAKRGFSEAMGALSEPKRSLSEAAAVAAGSVAESKRGFQHESGNGHASAEQKQCAARSSGYTDARASMINTPAGFADVRSSYLDSRPGCVFDHQNGDGKGASQQQQQQQQHANSRPQQQQHGTPSGFRVPSLPPPWQALDQSAASLGPFPSPKVAMDVSTMGKAPAEAPVVGWPPVRAFRKSTLSSPTPASIKSATGSPAAAPAGAPAPSTPTAPAVVPSAQQRPVMEGMSKVMRPTPSLAAAAADSGCRANGAPASSPNSVTSNYWFVKVYMDGVPFGRKVDLRIHGCYDKLSVGLEEMFTRYANVEQGSNGENKPLKFLQGSDYVLTYEDQDGDLMLVGDVPWNMFITSVKRLRIMKSSEAVGIAPRNSPKLWKGGAT